MIDFHCHLDLYSNPHEIAGECLKRNVIVLSVTTTPSAWNGTLALGNGRENIYTALGLHPELAGQRYTELDLFDRYLPLTRYVGEIGLDGSPELRPNWSIQQRVFIHILRSCASAGGRLLSIHSRLAADAVLDCLSENSEAGTAVLHWFSGTRKELDRAIDLGCWFSVGPAMLYSKKGRALVAKMPCDRVITETDGPFTQLDNRPTLPWQVDRAVDVLSQIWILSTIETCKRLHGNITTLLGRHPRAMSTPEVSAETP